jgi:hypothetical protein
VQLDLTDEETAALTRLLSRAIDADRYPLRIQRLKTSSLRFQPEPVREPLPPIKQYEPARATARRRR